MDVKRKRYFAFCFLLFISCDQEPILDEHTLTETDAPSVLDQEQPTNFEFDRDAYAAVTGNSSIAGTPDRPLPHIDTLQVIYDMILYHDDQESFLTSFTALNGYPDWNRSSVIHSDGIENYYVSIPWSLDGSLTGVLQFLSIDGENWLRFLTSSNVQQMMLAPDGEFINHTVMAVIDMLYFKNRVNLEIDSSYINWLNDREIITDNGSQSRTRDCFWFQPDEDCQIWFLPDGTYVVYCTTYDPIWVCPPNNSGPMTYPCSGCSGTGYPVPDSQGDWIFDPNHRDGIVHGPGPGPGNGTGNNNNDDNWEKFTLTQHKAARRALADLGIDGDFIDVVEDCVTPDGAGIIFDNNCAFQKVLEEVYGVEIDINTVIQIDGIIYGIDTDGVLHIYLPSVNMITASDQEIIEQFLLVIEKVRAHFCETMDYEPIDWKDFFEPLNVWEANVTWEGYDNCNFAFNHSGFNYNSIMDTQPSSGSITGNRFIYRWTHSGSQAEIFTITTPFAANTIIEERILGDCP